MGIEPITTRFLVVALTANGPPQQQQQKEVWRCERVTGTVGVRGTVLVDLDAPTIDFKLDEPGFWFGFC